jgi:hypothetical protein
VSAFPRATDDLTATATQVQLIAIFDRYDPAITGPAGAFRLA